MSAPDTARTTDQSRHEALDSIKQTVAGREGTTHTTSDSLVSGGNNHAGSSGVLEPAKPPASNPGSDDPTGGIAAGSGGKSSTAHIGSPLSVDSDSQSHTGGTSISTQISEVVSSFASALGLGGSATTGHDAPRQAEVADAENRVIGGTTTTDNKSNDTTTGTQTQKAYDYAAAGAAAVAGTAATAAATVTGRNDRTFTSKQADHPTTSSSDVNNNNNNNNNTTTTTFSSSTDSTTSPYPSKMSDNTSSNPSTDDSVPDRNVEDTSSKGEGKDLQPTGKPPASGGVEGGKRGFENPDAIPTAGGERLGQKHWGESQPVPDLPKSQEEGKGAGVSSTAGQPTQEVQDNTAKNTGGATSGPGAGTAPTSTEPKPSVVDKVKGVLNIGKD